MTKDDFPKVFLEGPNVPTEAIGVECKREREASSALPPINFIHVWWARRPLTVSRFAIVGSLVGEDWTASDVLELCGVPKGKDPLAAHRRIEEANQKKIKLAETYGYQRAFKNSISPNLLLKFQLTCQTIWKTKTPLILDLFSGGGSIPFETERLGLKIESVELNPVACIIQKATVEYPSQFGHELMDEVKKVGYQIAKNVQNQLNPYFPKVEGEEIFAYVWVRSVRCKECGFDAPLSPNWWLDTENKIGFRPIVKRGHDAPIYEIVEKGKNGFDPEKGSVAGGNGECIRCGQPIPEDYIKKEARAGRMGHQMAAVGFKYLKKIMKNSIQFKDKGKRKGGRYFRSPTEDDLAAFEAAKKELKKRLPAWEKEGLVPTEQFPEISNDPRPLVFGMPRWCDFFNPRQLLVHLTTLEELRNYDWSSIPDGKKRKAVRTLLALAMDKTLDYNAVLSRLDSSRVVVKNVFDRHDFAFIWNYGEIDGAGHLFRFGVDQIVDAYKGLVELLHNAKGTVKLHCADARNLHWIEDESVHAIVTDPPYYANVMYSELSDFFYVWLKRSVGDLYPEWFSAPLTDKEAEAVANSARFKAVTEGRGSANEAAERDYELKMTQAWREAARVLKPGGVLTVMFNHKELDAWDALAKSLINAGFTITASWAIATESEHSLHIREKQAVVRNIILVARKLPRGQGAWWDDVRKEVRQEVRKKLKNVLNASPYTTRVDLLMSAYGEGLRTVSNRWPVRDAHGNEIPIKTALAEARAALQEWYFELKIGHSPSFDNVTKVVLYALEGYGTRETKFDDIHKFGLALGVSVEALGEGKVADRKRSKVVFLDPVERAKLTTRIAPDKEEYLIVWDKIQAAALQFDHLDEKSFKKWIRDKGFLADSDFKDACQFLASECPSDFLEVKMARSVVPSGALTRVEVDRKLESFSEPKP